MVRIILELPKEADVKELEGYNKCWFNVQDNTSRQVEDLANEFRRKFFPKKVLDFVLLLNGIMLPEFTSESILRDNDILKLVVVYLEKREPKITNTCKEITKDDKVYAQTTSIPKNIISTEVAKVDNISKKVVEESSSEDESSSEESSEADDEMEVTAPVKQPVIITPKVKLTPRQIQVKKAPSTAVNPTTSTPKTNPYLVQSEVKISNNYTKTPPAFLKTTPTHKDRYTNRSKVYKTPDKIEAENLSKVLKSEVKDITQSAKKRKHSDDGAKEAKKRDVLQRSTEKGQIFQTRVSALLKITPGQTDGATVQNDSSSEEESELKPAEKIPRDSSSEDEVVVKPVVIASKPISGASSSESEEGEVQPDPKKKLELASGSSSEESDSEVDVVNTPARPPVITPATRENQHFTAAAAKVAVPVTQPPVTKPPVTKSESKSSSEESSSDEEEAKPAPAVPLAESSGSSSDEEPAVQAVQRGGMVGSVVHQSRLIPEVKTDKYYSLLSSLQGAPRVSDKLAFKMLGMSSDYTPEISAYKEGVVTGFDLSSQSVTIRLCPEFAIVSGGGKFELEEDHRLEDLLTLNLRQLIEPKLVPIAANGG